MKKLLLSLGALASVAAPVAAVVACGSTTPDDALAKLKKIDIDTAKQTAKNDVSISEGDLNKLIGEINGAKTIDELTNVMSTLNHVPNNGGSTDNSGADNGDKTVVTGPAKVNTGSTDNSGSTDSDAVATYKAQQIKRLDSLVLTNDQKDAAIKAINAATDKDGVNKAAQAATILDSAAKAAAKAAAQPQANYDATNNSVSVKITLADDDFKNHVDAEVAKAIFTALGKDFGTKAKALTKIEISVTDGSTTKTESKDITIASASTPAHTNTVINMAIDSISEKIAETKAFAHDIEITSSEYATLMIARLEKVPTDLAAIETANKILEAVGNGTRFIDGDKYETVFGVKTPHTKGEVSKTLATLLKPYIDLEKTANPTLATKLTSLIDGITA